MIYEALHDAAPPPLREWMEAHRTEVDQVLSGGAIVPGTTFRPSHFLGLGVSREDLTVKEGQIVDKIVRDRFGEMHGYSPRREVVVELWRQESTVLTRSWKERASNILHADVYVKRIDPELGPVLDLDSTWRYSASNGRLTRHDRNAKYAV